MTEAKWKETWYLITYFTWRFMKKLIFIFSFILSTTTYSYAQELPKFKIGVSAVASEFSDVLNFKDTQYNPNLQVEALGTIGKVHYLRFSAGVVYRRNFDSKQNIIHIAGQASYHLSIFEPFARFSAGIDYLNGIDNRTFSREVTLGSDVNLGHFYVRPLAVGFKRTGAFLSPAERTFQSGVGFSF